MKQSKDLERLLKSLDGQKYGAYKRMKGIYQFDQFRLAMIMSKSILLRHLQKCVSLLGNMRLKFLMNY